MADANAANLSPATVIEFAIAYFLGSGDATVISTPAAHGADDGSSLAERPLPLQSHIVTYAVGHEMPPEFVVELAFAQRLQQRIAHFLDPDSVTFDDYQVGIQRDRVESLKHLHVWQ